MIWFDFLQKRGYFASESNPAPIIENGGAIIPFWDSLTYLTKLSVQIKNGKHSEYAGRIIQVIIDASSSPKDNYRTWYTFIDILGNLPNDKVPIEVLMHIPTWLADKYETTLQTSTICELLLPKFLNETPSTEDINKAECILKHLFAIHELTPHELSHDSLDEKPRYTSHAHLYFLKTSLVNKELIPRIIKSCSDEIILFIARNLKRILLNSPITAILNSEPEDYLLQLTISGKNLVISSRKGSAAPTEILTVADYEISDAKTLLGSIKDAVVTDNIHSIDEAALQSIVDRLSIDFRSFYFRESIADLGDEISNEDDLEHVFAFLLRELLREKAKQDPVGAVKVFKTLIYDKKYRIAYLRRLVLDAIAENPTSEMREAFWKMVNVKDEQYFTDDKYEAEVLRVLKALARFFTFSEVDLLNQVLKSKDPLTDDKGQIYWKFRILEALKENKAFKDEYKNLSDKLNLTENDLQESRRIATEYHFETPYTAKELQEMSADEIVKVIESFKYDRAWRGTSVEGLGRALQEAVRESPDRFSKHLMKFDQLPHAYVYHLLEGFRESWKNKGKFSWEELLAFCFRYVSTPVFETGKLKTEQDGWLSDPSFVVGTIGHLITDGTRSDDHAFDPSYLTTAKELIVKLVSGLHPGNRLKASNMDYITYVINSSSGRMLQALLDYSLRVSRTTSKNSQIGSWDFELKTLFEMCLNRKMLDAFVLTGMYYQQFYYLDAEWMSNTFKAFNALDDELWRGFMGGLFFASAPFNRDVYEVAAYHYERAIGDETLNSKSLHERNIAPHLGVFYLRGYEDLRGKNVITDFLTRSHPKQLGKLIGFFRMQQIHLKKLESNEWVRYASLTINLWEYLINMYEKNEYEEYQRMLSDLIGLIGYIDQLDERTTDLVVKTVRFTNRSFHTNQLLAALLLLKDKGNKTENAHYLGQILNALNLNMYLPTIEMQILTLIEFIYQNGSKASADGFCHKLGIHGYIFQKDVFQKYNVL